MIPLLSHPNDEIVREVLAFLKAILFSGNRDVQKGLEYLLHTREEGLFTTMQGLLTNAAMTHRERCIPSVLNDLSACKFPHNYSLFHM